MEPGIWNGLVLLSVLLIFVEEKISRVCRSPAIVYGNNRQLTVNQRIPYIVHCS